MSYLVTDHDSRSYYLVRHSLVFCIFVVGVWALYQIGKRHFQNWRWGLVSAVLLVLSPRFFAEAFYNGKDIVYMSFFALAMLTLLRLLTQPSMARAILHGLATALVVDVRVHGVQLLLFTALGLFLDNCFNSSRIATTRHTWKLAGAYMSTVAIGVIIGWPYLWARSISELLSVASHAVRYPWGFTNFYLGEQVLAKDLPWRYIPVWMLITIPLPYSLAAGVGLLSWLRHLWHEGLGFYLSTSEGRINLLLALWLLAPIAVVVSTHTVVYEGWRHLYYIYPALLLWAVHGFRMVARLSRQRSGIQLAARTALGLAALEAVHTTVRMVQMHPHANVYFSFLPGSTAERLFERDYWCLAYRQGMEWIATHDTASTLTVNTFWHYPLYNNSLILKPEQRRRLRYTPGNTACYYLAGYRWHPQSYLDSLGAKVYVIRAGGIKVLSVFKRLPQTPNWKMNPPANSVSSQRLPTVARDSH
ncbi:glycosyltransferase family 39 protein [Hymenobacter volaticus]|uniref:Glycosyltransferase family 39 protein n=1 Tax=Hymenobacter volaticus TaxID=2932254 RepID=A0ABY4G5B6_9BACT|nr:glycosyltransferase family 39 protein [Hymenobacter volaticus]UOQ66089.1 glycosyltransferase family 39 protein [Hymenobacter volaticus]